MTDKNEKISSMAIVVAKTVDGSKILLLNNEGEWVFPKGHVEAGETFLKAAIRELFEESGVNVKENQSLGQIDEFRFYFDGEKAVKVIKVFAFITNQIQKIIINKSEGFVSGGWFDTKTAMRKLKHDDARNSLKKLCEMLNLN